MDNDLKYMKIAYQEAILAYQKDEVPVGAIIVKDDKIISKAYNLRENKQQAIAHAEIIAIEKACEILKTWRLDNCTLYVTLEPCLMCSGARINSRISRVVYGASDIRWFSFEQVLNSSNLNHRPLITSGIYQEKCQTLLKDYFLKKRMK